MKWRLDPGQIEVVDEAVAEILRKKTPAERIQLAGEAWDLAWKLLEGAVLRDHPDWTPEQIRAEVRRRISRESDGFIPKRP